MNKVSHLMACARAKGALRLAFVCVRDCWLVAPEMNKSAAWEKMYHRTQRDPLLAVKIQVTI